MTELDKPASARGKRFRILAIDGGGIKGIIPASLLCDISSNISRPVWEYFDLICGTSTGGIIALAIALNKSPEEILKLYMEMAREIFPPPGHFIHKLSRRCRVILGAGAQYDTRKLARLLREAFSSEGVPHKMIDAKTRLCIPAIDITNGKVVVYKTPHSVMQPREEVFHIDKEKQMWEIAMATSAAPTFFQPMKISDAYHVDGGIWANNPSLVGVIEAIRSGYNLTDMSVLSLGTGETAFQVEQSKASKMNMMKWGVRGLVELAFQSQSQAVENQVASLLGPERYLRVQHQFQSKVALDDVTRLHDLCAAAHSLYRDAGTHIINRFFRDPTDRANSYSPPATAG